MSIIWELISNGQSKIHAAIVGAGKDATQFSAYSPHNSSAVMPRISRCSRNGVYAARLNVKGRLPIASSCGADSNNNSPMQNR